MAGSWLICAAANSVKSESSNLPFRRSGEREPG
jgi:hypothetical protein